MRRTELTLRTLIDAVALLALGYYIYEKVPTIYRACTQFLLPSTLDIPVNTYHCPTHTPGMPVYKPGFVVYAPAKFRSQPWWEPDTWFDASGNKRVVLPYVPQREKSFEEILTTRISRGVREFKVRRSDTQNTEWVQIIHLLVDEQFDMLEDWLDVHPHVRKRIEEPVKLYGFDKHLEILREYETRVWRRGQGRKKGEQEEKCEAEGVDTPKVSHLVAPEKEYDALEHWLDEYPQVRKKVDEPVKLYGSKRYEEALKEYKKMKKEHDKTKEEYYKNLEEDYDKLNEYNKTKEEYYKKIKEEHNKLQEEYNRIKEKHDKIKE